ncbi:MAG: hypothetical protein HY238_07155 [Acidobacteria bacterium]|nr:hypothetical protein [Acidobacteriota bacterium]
MRTTYQTQVSWEETESSPIRMSIRNRRHSEPAAPQSWEVARPTVLLVMCAEGSSSMLGGLEALGIEIVRVPNCTQARRILEECPDVRTVLTELTLPDGDWRTVVDVVAACCVNTEVVVLGRAVDARLRRHVLDSGAYDLLVEPCRPGEVGRVVGGAVLTSYRRYIGISGLSVV